MAGETSYVYVHVVFKIIFFLSSKDDVNNLSILKPHHQTRHKYNSLSNHQD
jgi:hypothetical protein